MILTKPKSVNAGPSSGTGEGVAHSKRWYVALVRMHHEKKVAERLSKMGIDSFVPVQQQIHQWSDRRKMVDTVLLPMMVFVHVNPKERMEVLSFSTVSRYMVMRGESTPAVIPDEPEGAGASEYPHLRCLGGHICQENHRLRKCIGNGYHW